MLAHLLSLLFWLASDVQQLAANDYTARLRAQQHLQQYDWLLWRLLDHKFQDPERRRRARWVVEGYLHQQFPADNMPFIVDVLHPGKTMYEWHPPGVDRDLCQNYRIGKKQPAPGWQVVWVHGHFNIMPKCQPYLEAVRYQDKWVWWFTPEEQRAATRLWVETSFRQGVPVFWLRWQLDAAPRPVYLGSGKLVPYNQ